MRTAKEGNSLKKILVIGSAVVDVIIHLEDHVPVRGEDVHALSQEMRMGGCAYNTSDTIRHFRVPYIPFFPVGTGTYGDFVRKSFREKKIPLLLPTPSMDNGCCYCLIEQDGERSFISWHGAEYRIQREWFSLLDPEEIHSIYICGLEIEATGPNIVSFLETLKDIPVYFAPGPRLMRIDPHLIDRIFALHPILHLNDEEACIFTGQKDYPGAAKAIYAKTLSPVIITLGKEGCYYFDPQDAPEGLRIPAENAEQIDSTGAGDAHIGAVMACRYRGDSMADAIRTANRVSAKIVSVDGALLPDSVFDALDV